MGPILNPFRMFFNGFRAVLEMKYKRSRNKN
jgi:hypothetical protein